MSFNFSTQNCEWLMRCLKLSCITAFIFWFAFLVSELVSFATSLRFLAVCYKKSLLPLQLIVKSVKFLHCIK